MDTKYKIKEHYTEQFNMRVPKSLKLKDARARGLGIDVTSYMRKYYEEFLEKALKDFGEEPTTLIPGKKNSF